MDTKQLLIACLIAIWGLTACSDKCEQTRVYRKYTPLQVKLTDLRQPVKSTAPRGLEEPGKIYVKDSYLFIIETKQGIHVIDNTDPANPRPLSFIPVPGTVDLAVRDNILYADSYIDLVALDISNPTTVREVSRIQTGFTSGLVGRTNWSYNPANDYISDSKEEVVTEVVKTDCESNLNIVPYPFAIPWFGWYYSYAAFDLSSASKSSIGQITPNTGTGGSTARFAAVGDNLYVVNQNSLQLINIADPAHPQRGAKAQLNWNVETIFPYRQKLFIGTNQGMYIYDISQPADPKLLSSYDHIRACDPVVVEGNYAYITLRGTNACRTGSSDLLEIVDISNLSSPKRVVSYPLENPYGLAINYPTLYVGRGGKGLQVIDVTDPVNPKIQRTYAEVNALDLIPLNKTLLVIGTDGLYQYAYSQSASLQLLSKISAKKPY